MKNRSAWTETAAFGSGNARFHHGHEHHHHTASGNTPDRQQALLAYMLDHNRHHAEELHEMGHELGGEVADLIHEAVELFEQGNDKLEAALNLVKGE